MMKLFNFFALSLCSLTFFSCSQKKNEKILKTYHEQIDSFIYADDKELIDLHNNSQDFILFLYSDCGCGGNSEIAISSFKDYIKENKTIIYATGEEDYLNLPLSLSDVFPKYPSEIKEKAKKIPSLYFYKDGNLIKSVSYSSKFNSSVDIAKIIDQYTYSNGKYCLNDLSEFKHKDEIFYKFDYENTIYLNSTINTKNACIYFYWKACSDCFSFKTYERKLFENYDSKLYYFDVNYFITNRDEHWYKENSFPFKYQFSEYRGGKVPSIVNFVSGKKESFIVYHNDVKVDNVITESFFEELISQNLSEKEINDYEGNKVIEYIKEHTRNE